MEQDGKSHNERLENHDFADYIFLLNNKNVIEIRNFDEIIKEKKKTK